MGDVESTCERIIVLEGGKVVEDDAVSQLTKETETLYVEVLDRSEELLVLPQQRGLEAGLDGTSSIAINLGGRRGLRYDPGRDSRVRGRGSGVWLPSGIV